MTIAPCGAGVNAAQEPRPANGMSDTPSTVTGTSLRGKAMRITPSGAVVALVAAAVAILSAFNACPAGLISARSDGPESTQAELLTTTTKTPLKSQGCEGFMVAFSWIWCTKSLRFSTDERQVVEVSLGIGLRPQADHP